MDRKEMERELPLYANEMRLEEIKQRSICKYLRDINKFLDYMAVWEKAEHRTEVGKDAMIAYKKELICRYKPSSVNSYVMSINRYVCWLGRPDLKLKLERIQRRCSLNHVLEMEDYRRLLAYTRETRRVKYYCIMRTLAATGIRVGELQFITYGAVSAGVAVITHKGKTREICIPDRLKLLLLEYCREKGITEGYIFHGRFKDRPLDVSGIWKGLKRMALSAGVDPEKVYPHSFRHFFAKTYMREIGNLTELCDILGHSSIETTRIYTMETIQEKRASLERLAL